MVPFYLIEITTVGVSENILEASYHALADSIRYKLLRERDKKRQQEKTP